MCIDMCIDMCTDMCIVMSEDIRQCTDTSIDMSINQYADRCVDMGWAGIDPVALTCKATSASVPCRRADTHPTPP